MKFYLNWAWWQGHESSDSIELYHRCGHACISALHFCGSGLYWGFSSSDRNNYTQPRLGKVCLCLLPGRIVLLCICHKSLSVTVTSCWENEILFKHTVFYFADRWSDTQNKGKNRQEEDSVTSHFLLNLLFSTRDTSYIKHEAKVPKHVQTSCLHPDSFLTPGIQLFPQHFCLGFQ